MITNKQSSLFVLLTGSAAQETTGKLKLKEKEFTCAAAEAKLKV